MIFGKSKKLPAKFALPLDKNEHRITILFPTYAPCKLNSITLYKILDKEPKPRNPPFILNGRPIIYYGSSITQGGCTSRPSLNYAYLLSEKLNVNFINLGTSGVGYGEPEVAEYVSSFKDACMFVFDCVANLLHADHGNLLEQRYKAFWQKIHEKNPKTPILFIGFQGFFQENIEPMAKIYIQIKREFVENEAKQACVQINKERDRKLFDSINGLSLFNAGELHYTVDGVHPNDLGHKRYAETIFPKMNLLLRNINDELI
jgi:lysophospholipase L1-like esterase